MDELNKSTYLSVDCIGYKTDNKLWPLFSTISKIYEKSDWGSKYPILLNHLCDNSIVEIENLNKLKAEIERLSKTFYTLKIKDIFLNYENENEKIVCNDKNDILDDIEKYFKINNGDDLLKIIYKATCDAIEFGVPLKIKSL